MGSVTTGMVALGKSKDGRNKQNQTELYGDTGRLVYLA
jgi:hypothetical protein